MLACTVLEEAFLRAVVGSASQARQPDQERHFALLCLRRKVQIEFHFASCCRCIVSKLEKLPAKRGYGGGGLDRHLDLSVWSVAAIFEQTECSIFVKIVLIVFVFDQQRMTWGVEKNPAGGEDVELFPALSLVKIGFKIQGKIALPIMMYLQSASERLDGFGKSSCW